MAGNVDYQDSGLLDRIVLMDGYDALGIPVSKAVG